MLRTKEVLLGLGVLVMMVSCGNKEKKVKSEVIKKRPNIIFIMDDQHKYDALGLINEQVLTPTLDSLAASGTYYNQAVCQAPMCVPSRNSIMFGLYPNQTGVYRNTRGGVSDDSLPGKTMAQYFKDAGYETAGFGKTHWGRYKTGTRGFETRYVSEIAEDGAISMQDLNPEAKRRYNGETKTMGAGEENNLGYLGFTSELPEEDHRDGWITKQAIEYINKREDERPLFFYLSYMKPHAGHNVPKGYEDLYDVDNISFPEQPNWDKDYSPHSEGINRREMYENYWKDASEEDWKLMTMRYYANVTWIDDMMGRTLDALKKKGILDNAIVIYTSDHGEMLGERYYRFNKYNLYESSVRVPMIVSGSALPESFKGGKVNSHPTENIDILPTLLDLAEIDMEKKLPGRNLLENKPRKASFSALHEREGEAAFMWRTRQYKLILVFHRKKEAADYRKEDIITGEFYDLHNDTKEWYDLYGKKEIQPIQEQFTSELLEHLQSM
ncbi:sulfatase family protein [Zobellia russellii]|uniref:sulfatase family protein n=1 Tax=Zobellia russellii TaxID=248907 RepID=UPI001BFF7861|nr:sulfatase-like hydrolase/transferase [Zobellia russellii]MBT9188284.1 sulfatase-like hydrolase/transferase [Zobellia russellii]